MPSSRANFFAASKKPSLAYDASLTVLILICSNGVKNALPITSADAAHNNNVNNL